jgi:nitrate reductase NapD
MAMARPPVNRLTRREFIFRVEKPQIHIASCVVQVRPEHMQAARPLIESVIGGPIDASDSNRKLVVVLEGPTTSALLEKMEKIRAIHGVLNIEMVYQHAEDESAMKEFVS